MTMSRPTGNAGVAARVQASRLRANLEHLFALGKEEGREGAWRLAFSPADIRGRAFVLELMCQIGLSPRVDPAGNLIGTRRGSDPELPALIIGSHIDTVPGGGMFDGGLGVVGGIEGLRAMHEAGYQAAHTVEVVAFSNEEKARFQGPGGSSAMVKGLDPRELEGVKDAEGNLLTGAMEAAGVDPAGVAGARRTAGFCGGYLELHIEQGGRMAAAGTQVGVVAAIVGITRARLSFEGRPNHAGTTAMGDRRDALWGAAEFVGEVRRAAIAENGNLVGTVGVLKVSPGAVNVVPGRVDLAFELRSADEGRVNRVLEALFAQAAAIASRYGLQLQSSASTIGRAVPMDPGIRDQIEGAAGELGLRHTRLVSWAGHDASHFAPIAPTGMIFVPSIGGISHAPDEMTSWEDAEAGVKVLAETVCRLDRLGVQAKRT